MNQLLTTLQERRAQDSRDARLLRLEAVVEVLYASGMRISELTGLDLQSVDRANKTVRVLGKRAIRSAWCRWVPRRLRH